jgi:polyisoprenoid-binding protein YceI
MAQSTNNRETLKSIGQQKQVERKASAAPTIIINSRTSSLEWKGGLKVVNKNHSGNLKLKSGNIYLNEGNKISGSIVINMISMTNIDLSDSKKEYLIGHLRSQDFFDVERFPVASLKIKNSKILEKQSNGKYNMEISGDLTIKSVTKPVVFTALIDLGSDIKSASGTMKLNRIDFGVRYRSEIKLDDAQSFWNDMQTTKKTTMDKVIKDQIEVKFDIMSMSGVLER